MSFRTLRVSPEELVQLLTDLSVCEIDREGDAIGIPVDTAVSKVRLLDDRTIELELVHHRWPTPGPGVVVSYKRRARRFGPTSSEGVWSEPIAIGAARA